MRSRKILAMDSTSRPLPDLLGDSEIGRALVPWSEKLQQEDRAGALVEIQGLVRDHPGNRAALIALAETHRQLGNIRAAAKICRKVVRK
jgi:predicted Zn-dependent protease